MMQFFFSCPNDDLYQIWVSYLQLIQRYLSFSMFFNSVTSFWPWNEGQMWPHFWNPWVWLPIPCQYIFLLLNQQLRSYKPLKLYKFIPRNSRNYIGKNIGHRKLPWTNLRKGPFRKILTWFVSLWLLWFWRRRFLNFNQFFKILA